MAQLLRKTSFALLLSLVVATGVALPVTSEAAANAAARIQFVVGDVTATSTGGDKRQLKKGDRLYAGDTIQSGDNGAAQIIYRDRSRMAVRVNTTFKIETYEFDSKDESKGSSVFSLLSGALRAVTGLIGQANKENVTINTPLATIGIRGTDHEVVHIVQQRGSSIAKAGTYNKVYQGGTELRTRAGKINIDLRQTGFIEGAPGRVGKPVKIPDLPQAIKTQIIDKVPMQARVNQTPATKEAASATGKTQPATSGASRAGAVELQPATKAGLQELAPALGTAKGNALLPGSKSDSGIGRVEGLSVPATKFDNTFSNDLKAAPATAIDPGAIKGFNPEVMGGSTGRAPATEQMMKNIEPVMKAPAVMPSVPLVPATPKAVIPSVPVMPVAPKAVIPSVPVVPAAPKASIPSVPVAPKASVPLQSMPKGSLPLPGGAIKK